MADVFPKRDEEERPRDLDPDAAPSPIGVYDRPEGAGGRSRSVVMFLIIFVLLLLAYYVIVNVLL